MRSSNCRGMMSLLPSLTAFSKRHMTCKAYLLFYVPMLEPSRGASCCHRYQHRREPSTWRDNQDGSRCCPFKVLRQNPPASGTRYALHQNTPLSLELVSFLLHNLLSYTLPAVNSGCASHCTVYLTLSNLSKPSPE